MLNHRKFEKLMRGLTPVAAKVYAVVPMETSWATHQICAETERLGTPVQMHILQGCLNSLTEQGLVREIKRGYFIRELVRAPAAAGTQLADALGAAMQQKEAAPVAAKEKSSETVTPTPKETEMSKPTAQEHLATIRQISARIEDLNEQLIEQQSMLEAAHKALMDSLAAESKELNTLRQLKSLLANLNA